jgi:hypothetical protein
MAEPSPAAVEVLFQQAADLLPEERAAFLDAECDGDVDLRAAVEELLHFDARLRALLTSYRARPPTSARHCAVDGCSGVIRSLSHSADLRRRRHGGGV